MALTNSNKMGNNGGRAYSFLNKPVLVDCNFVVDSANANGLGIASLKGAGVQNVFMHTSGSAGRGANNYLNPNPASGLILVQLNNNYNRVALASYAVSSPNAGSNLAINASALTAGQPYVVTAVGHGTLGAVTIAPVADSSGSLASKWFYLYDNYGNTFIIWISVDGVGTAPQNVAGTLVQLSIASGATAAQVGAALVLVINNLPSGVSGVFSFTSAGTTTVTVTSTQTNPYAPLTKPAEGLVPTGFTFAQTVTKTNDQNWRNVGLPSGISASVGAAFVATAAGDSSGGGSTGLVKLAGVSAISSIEMIGDPSKTISPAPIGASPFVGGFVLLQALGPTISTGAYIAPMLPTAPADGSVIYLKFYLEAGSILISGE